MAAVIRVTACRENMEMSVLTVTRCFPSGKYEGIDQKSERQSCHEKLFIVDFKFAAAALFSKLLQATWCFMFQKFSCILNHYEHFIATYVVYVSTDNNMCLTLVMRRRCKCCKESGKCLQYLERGQPVLCVELSAKCCCLSLFM